MWTDKEGNKNVVTYEANNRIVFGDYSLIDKPQLPNYNLATTDPYAEDGTFLG